MTPNYRIERHERKPDSVTTLRDGSAPVVIGWDGFFAAKVGDLWTDKASVYVEPPDGDRVEVSDLVAAAALSTAARKAVPYEPRKSLAQAAARYTVEAYDNFDHPNERCCSKVGEFDTAEEAIACAKDVVDASLERARGAGKSAAQWYQEYFTAGDGVYLHGKPSPQFNPYDYARARIGELSGERPK